MFINESLECLMISSRRKSQGKPIDPSVHILMQMLKDIFDQYGFIRLIVCMAPSVHDLQDTLNTMSFATRTRKVRTAQGPQNELEGLREPHFVKLN